jgi:hypothetical protein
MHRNSPSVSRHSSGIAGNAGERTWEETTMRMKKIVSGALVALGVAAPMVLAAGTAQAAPGSDLDLTSCKVVDDPVDYGDGIDWYKIEYTMVNEGSAPTGSFVSRAKPVYGKDEFSGQFENEAFVKFSTGSLAPGQSRSDFFWVTKKTVDQRTWGIHLDVTRVTGESQTNDSFCSAFVNNT